MVTRKNSRKLAVQAIFQFFFSKDDINKILDEFCTYRIKEIKNYKKKYDIKFLRNIVRAIVGTMLLVGRKKITVQEFSDIIASKSRSSAGPSVKAKGLFLTKVDYNNNA